MSPRKTTLTSLPYSPSTLSTKSRVIIQSISFTVIFFFFSSRKIVIIHGFFSVFVTRILLFLDFSAVNSCVISSVSNNWSWKKLFVSRHSFQCADECFVRIQLSSYVTLHRANVGRRDAYSNIGIIHFGV